MDLQKLKKDLMSKGIFVVASTNEITAGLAWSVEGIDKVPKLGELLFYKINGVEYGVKPKKGNKHDIHWYYDQLKTGMKGAKGYSAGLTQFLNVWIKKGELVIVFKSNKATASVTSAKRLSSQEKCDSIINGLKNGSINGDELFKTITKEYNLTPDCVAATRWLIKEWGQEDIQNNNEWPIRFRKLYNLHGVKFLNKYLNDLLLDSRSELSGGSSESILDGLYKKFKGDKVVSSPQLVSETGIDNLLRDMKIKSNKWNHGATGICWDIVLKVKKVLVIEYREDEGTAILTYRNGSAKKDIKGIETIADLKDKLEKYLSKINADRVTSDVCEVKETLGELNEENFEGINKEHDRLMYTKVTPEQFLQLWKTSPNFNGQQIQKIVYGFKLALRTLNSKFENKGILIECFYKKKDGKGYIRVEYDKDLYIIYVSRAEDNGEVKVITRKMRKVIPTKNFNLLSTSVSSLAFERSNLPSGFKPVWEEVSK